MGHQRLLGVKYNSPFATILTAGWAGFVFRLVWLAIAIMHFGSFLNAWQVSMFAYSIISFVEASVLLILAGVFAWFNSYIMRDLRTIAQDAIKLKNAANMAGDGSDASIELASENAQQGHMKVTKWLSNMTATHFNYQADLSTFLGGGFWSIWEVVLVAYVTFNSNGLNGSTTAWNSPNAGIQLWIQVVHVLYVLKMLYFFLKWFNARLDAVILASKLTNIEVENQTSGIEINTPNATAMAVNPRVALQARADQATVPLTMGLGAKLNFV